METHDGFSIREYVSRMRSVNVAKCWPFDQTAGKESVKSLLPPITVKKFIWWSGELLENLHSQSSKNVDNSKKKKKKNVQEKGESSFRNENDVEESDVVGMEMVKVKSSRAKAKVPKKRSILEIFAVAPPVEMINSGDEEEEEEEEDRSFQEEDGFCIGSKLSCNEEIKSKRNEKEKKKRKTKNKEIQVIKKIKKRKKKKKKEDDKIDPSVPNKDQDNAIENQNSADTKDNENDIRDHVSICKKKPRPQHVDADKTSIAGKASRLIARNRNLPNPKFGTLKKASALQQSEKCLLKETVQVNHSGKRKADKHVQFLQKDNRRRKLSLCVEHFKLQKCCASDIHSVQHASNVGKDSVILENNGAEDASNRIVNEANARPASEEQPTIHCCMADKVSFMKQHSKKATSISRSVTPGSTVDDKKKHLFDTYPGEAPHDLKYACIPVSSYMSNEVHYNSQNTKGIANSSSNGGRLNNNFDTPGPGFPPACLGDYLETCNEHEPLVSSLSNLGKGANGMPQSSTAMNDVRALQHETFQHLSPTELQQTLRSQPHCYERGNIRGQRTIYSINEDFVGLPLNSQGELIMLSSSANEGFKKTIKSSITSAPSISLSLPDNNLSKCFGGHLAHTSWDCRMSSREQLNLFPVKDFLEKNPVVFVPSRLDKTESGGNGKKSLDLDSIKIRNHSLHSEKSLCNEDNWVQKSHANEKILSKMRLMGKEFIVGGNGLQGFGDEHIWKDKQIIDGSHFSRTSIGNVMMHDQNEPSLGKLRENLFVPAETNNHISRSMYNFPHYDWQTSSTHKNGFVTRKINAAEKVYPGLSRATCSRIHDSKPLFSERFSCGCDSQVLNLELSTLPAADQDSCLDVSSSDVQLKNNQNLPHALRSAIRFPFMHPDLGGHAEPSWRSRSPHVSPSPWSLDVSGKGMFANNFQLYHDLGCSDHRVVPGNSWRPLSSVSTKPEAFHLYNPVSFGSTLQMFMDPSSQYPTLLTQQAPMLCYPEAMPVSSVWKRHENTKKIREGVKSRIGIRGPDHGRKAKRQTSAVSNVSLKPVTLPSLGLDKSSQCVITQSTTCVNLDGVQNIETAVESCSATQKSKNIKKF